MQRPQYSLAEKITMLASIASIFLTLLAFEVISPTYQTITSLIFNNGVVIIVLIIGVYWAFGRDVGAFTEHPTRIYVFSRIIAPTAGLIFFGENLTTSVGFEPFFTNFGGILTCLLVMIFGAVEEIRNQSYSEEVTPIEDIKTQEFRNIRVEEQKKKMVQENTETTSECDILV